MGTDSMEQLSLFGIPQYRVRVSARAKRAQLKVSPRGQVEVVIPQRFSRARVPAFVAENAGWILRTLEHLTLQRAARPDMSDAPPARITLPALGEEWQVHYRRAPRGRTGAAGAPGARLLQVTAPDDATARALLQGWLARRARECLVPWLRAVSLETGLPCAAVAVRAQRTRWGSCSARKAISINRSLLFLPPPVVRYLFVHELCHTVHLNHSRRYWALVARMEPDYERLDRALRDAGPLVPLWAQPD